MASPESKSRRKKLDKVLDEILTLPSLPEIVAEVTALVNDPDTGIAEIAKVIERDPALSMKLLRLVNSAFYGTRNEVTSIELAAALVGGRVLKNLVLNASVLKTLEGLGKKKLFDHHEFWAHSISCAVLAKLIGEKAEKGHLIDPEEAFTAGLLHDVGKIIIEQFLSDDFIQILEVIKAEGLPFSEAEERAGCLSHAEIGAALAEKWGLPLNLAHAVRYHHSSPPDSDGKYLACAVILADKFHHWLEEKTPEKDEEEADPKSPAPNPKILKELRLTQNDLTALEADFQSTMESGDLVQVFSE